MSAAPPTVAAARGSLRGWWLLAGLVFGLPLVVSALLWWWCATQGDLDAARDRLRAAGLPTSSAEWGRVVAEPDRRAMRRRVEVLTRALDTYRSNYWDMHLESAAPAGLVAFQGECDPARVAELESLLLALGDAPVADDAELPLYYGKGFNPLGTLHFLSQRICCSDPPAAERAARAALALVRAQDGLGSLLMPYRLYEICGAVTFRAAHGALFGPTLAGDLEATAARVLAEQPRAAAALAIVYLALFRGGVEHAMKTLGIAPPSIMVTAPLGALVFRSGRGWLIDRIAARARFLRDHSRPREWLDEAVRVARDDRRNPIHVLMVQTFDQQWSYAEGCVRNALRARALAAALRLAPWPEDLCDPVGGPLRPLTVRGQVIGAYSVGLDGKDDGGSRLDMRFVLRPKPLGAVGAE